MTPLVSSALILLLNFNALFFLVFNVDWAASSLSSHVIWKTLVFTILQAALSAVASVTLGLLAAPGYAALARFRRPARWLLLLPNMLSPILAVLCLLLVFKDFPYGLTGIVIGHVFMNSGLATVWLGERWGELENRWRPVNDVLGGSTWLFYRKGIFPQIIQQAKYTFAVIFSLCLVSFAVPLVLGGGPQASTLEVLIYEAIHAGADISGAVVIGLVQCAVQFVVFVAILRPILLKTEYSRLTQLRPRLTPALFPLFAVVLVSAGPLFELALAGLSQLSVSTLAALPDFGAATRLSVLVSLGVAGFTFAALALATASGWSRGVINAPALSGVAVGLGGLLIFRSTGNSLWPALGALLWGHISVIFLPVLRLSVPALGSLRARFEKVLQQLGAPRPLAFKRVYFPLGLKACLAGAVLAGCWSMGEFSIASILSAKQATLPVFIHQLMGSYRLEAASACSIVLLLLSIVSMTLFEVLAVGVG